MSHGKAKLFHNGSIYLTGSESSNLKSGSYLGQALLCIDDKIVHIGDYDQVQMHAQQLISNGALSSEDLESMDLQGKFLLPGFIDSHVHLSMQGESLDKVDLEGCTSLEEIQKRISDEIVRRTLSAGDKIQVKRFTIPMLNGKIPQKEYLDACSPDGQVAIFIDARDLHSAWLSTAALKALRIDSNTSTPAGGAIHKDGQGSPTGYLEEAACVGLVWNNLPKLYTTQQRKQSIKHAIQSWLQQGVTSIVDMAMNQDTLSLLMQILDEEKELPIRIACHWLVERKDSHEENIAQVLQAKQIQKVLQDQKYEPWIRIAGIKIITDGVIDTCTASIWEPYANGKNSVEPIWPLEFLKPVVRMADELDLQCAVHAIGDKAVDSALDAIEYAVDTNGPKENRRHRIEHLELTKAHSVPRLQKLGVTASVQAVHASPAVQENWKNMLGHDDRCNRAFAYGDFLSQGVLVALGTDAPTAHVSALNNVYIATTRLAPEPIYAHLPPTTPQYALSLLDALNAATISGAIAEKQEHCKGSLDPGLYADFAILSIDVVQEQGGKSLLKAKVEQTWTGGKLVYQRSKQDTIDI
ncbi:unnamed protein product [Sympodiomycopsis kandeliae]